MRQGQAGTEGSSDGRTGDGGRDGEGGTERDRKSEVDWLIWTLQMTYLRLVTHAGMNASNNKTTQT